MPIPSNSFLFFLTLRRTHQSTLFPYTTLFRSGLFSGRRRLANGPGWDGGCGNRGAGQQRAAIDLHHGRSEEHTSELQSCRGIVCRLFRETKTYAYLLEAALDYSLFRPTVLLSR